MLYFFPLYFSQNNLTIKCVISFANRKSYFPNRFFKDFLSLCYWLLCQAGLEVAQTPRETI